MELINIEWKAAVVESKILKNFFEEQHRKFKKRAQSILQMTHLNQFSPADSSEWLKHKTEADTTASHPFGIPAIEDEKISQVEIKMPPKISD